MGEATDDIELRAWEAWSRAWDEARDADKREGRRYDKERYAEAAHLARVAVLNGAQDPHTTGGE